MFKDYFIVGKVRFGIIMRVGDEVLCKILVVGVMLLFWYVRVGCGRNVLLWFMELFKCKVFKLVVVVLVNKIVWIVWKLMVIGEVYC